MTTLTGTSGNDSLVGGTGNDSLIGLDGNDTLDGGAGNDTMDGGAGNDTFVVDSFADQIIEAVGGGTDTIRTALLDRLSTFSLAPFTNVENLSYTGTVAAQLKGNAQANLIQANSGAATDDTLYGAAGNDTLLAYGGNDTLIGGSGNDSLDGGAGADHMVGGTGNDVYVVDNVGDRVYEYSLGGFDTIRSAVLTDLRQSWTGQIEGLVYTGSTAATLNGNALGNQITSNSASNDTLYGYAGNDTLDGGGGTDSMIGGDGNDVYYVSTADVVAETTTGGIDTFVGLKTSLNVTPYATTIENLFYTGATGATLTGNGLANVLCGGAGSDTVSGQNGDDSLAGGAGADSLVGGAGNDNLYGGGLAQFGYGAFVPDTAADTLVGGAGDDRYWIDSPADVVSEFAGGGTHDVVNSSIDNSLAFYPNVEALVLRSGTDAWYAGGSIGNDVLVGNSADNYLVGGAGNDTLAGSVDAIGVSGLASDVLDGGDGNDVLIAFFYGSSFLQETSLFGGLGDDLYVIGTGFLDVGGQDSGGNDTAVLIGSGSIAALEGVENVVLYGAGGAADTAARSALDAAWAAANPGQVYTGILPPTLDGTGNELANTITGNSLDNHLYGLDGNDTIIGGAGNDTLDGGAGNDSMTGGAGNDTYVIDSDADVVVEAPGGGFDLISSATLTSFAGYANVEGLIYTGTTGVALDNGAANTSNDYFGGGSGNDTLRGYGGNDTLDGGAGNDTIGGDAGNDSLRGADGNDTLDGGADNDTIEGGTGADLLHGGAGNDLVYGNVALTIPADTGGNTLFGDDGNDTLYGGALADALSGDAGNDSLIGGAGNDILVGGVVTNSGLYYVAGGDVLWGNSEFSGQGASDADQFRLLAPGADNHAIETSQGSGVFYFNTGTLIADFASGSDVIRFAAGMVGDGDTLLENVTVQDAPGPFSAASEMVIFRTDVAGATFNSVNTLLPFAASSVTAVIGSADAAFTVGAERLFVVDNGSSSAIFQFTSANADAVVTVDELSLVAVVNGNASLGASDFTLF